ncbi:MAG: trigger factor [Chitinophagales bacterium]|nr:trigger factor [Chitinophagales bacterium]
MEISKIDKDALNSTLSVNLKKEDYLPVVDKAITQLKKTMTMKGFRKGMVPISLIKKMYGESVMVDEVNKMVSKSINDYIKEKELKILGQPLPTTKDVVFDIKNPEDYTFEFDLGLSPEFEIPALKKDTVIKALKVNIDDEMLTKELDNMRLRFGSMIFPEEGVEEKDMLQVKFTELVDGAIKENGAESEGPINLEMVKDKTLSKKLKTAKLGDTFKVKDIFKTLDRNKHHISKHLLNLENEPEDLSPEFELNLVKISRMIPSEINQEFFDKAFGSDVVKTEEEAKEKIKTDLNNYLSQSEEGKLNSQIYNLLLDQTSIELPDEFLKKWIKVSNEKPITDEILEEEYPDFARNLKWTLIVNKITADNDLKGTFEEVKERSKEDLRKQLTQYATGGMAFSDDDLESFNNSMLGKEDHVKKTYDAVMEQKLFNAIKSQLTIEDELVSLDDFIKA